MAASTKVIKAEYSSKLDGMTSYIRHFLSRNNLSKDALARTYKGIDDFCFHNTPAFKKNFLQKIGLSKPPKQSFKTKLENQLNNFIDHLAKKEGECVFLLRDTQDALSLYNQKTGKGFGILANRNFLCKDSKEEDYFALIELVYTSLDCSNDIKTFLKNYLDNFEKFIQTNSHFRNRSQKIFAYINTHKKNKKVIFVDMGFQYTFSLFCRASVKLHSKVSISPDFYCFSIYPWLQEFFKGKYFSKNNELVLDVEIRATKSFYNEIKNKAAGSLVGFAIGDALGFPVAGIDRADVPKFINSEINSFTNNPKHPFFSHLKKGQYTENTNLLILSAEHLIKNKAFKIDKYQNDLIGWGKKVLKDPNVERWAGPTAIKAVSNLIQGKSYLDSGSTTTESCSATYRVIPLGIFYRPLFRDGIEDLKTYAEISAMTTHNSDISKTGAAITALIVADLIHGVMPETAVKASLLTIKETSKNKLLLEKIKQAIKFSKSKDIEVARKTFGSGSPIYQTLPMAIYCLLKYQNDFEKAVLAAANSYRDDTQAEKKRLMSLSWEEQLQEAKGGNTDGIAGLTGAFVGAHLGLSKIPKKFLTIENKNKLEKLSKKLL